MPWKRGSRAFLRLPLGILLLVLPLAVAAEERRLGASAEAEVVGGPWPPAEEATAPRGGRRLDEEEASRILWRGWLLVDEAPARRKAHITPKSVFIAPVIRGEQGIRGGGIPACAEGYRSDSMGRCHKVVRVNQAAHLDFLLQRLNALYREPSAAVAPSQVGAAEKGPLLVTIPLATGEPSDEGAEREEDAGEEVDLVVVAEASIRKGPLGDVPDRFDLLGEELATAASSQDAKEEAGGPPKALGDGDESAPTASERSGVEVEARPQYDREGMVTAPDAATIPTEENVEPPPSTSPPPSAGDDDPLSDAPVEAIAKDSNAEATTSDVAVGDGHVYATTVFADSSTTESSVDKVTVFPDVLHKQNQGIAPDGNSSDHRREEIARESQKKVVFPGRVEERITFPDNEGNQPQPDPFQISASASSETLSKGTPQSQRSGSRPLGGRNRPMLLKFWTQMPLIREAAHGPDNVSKDVLPATSDGDTSSLVKRGESWLFPSHSDVQSKVHHIGPYQRRPWIYYQEMSPRELASVSRVFDRVKNFETYG